VDFKAITPDQVKLGLVHIRSILLFYRRSMSHKASNPQTTEAYLKNGTGLARALRRLSSVY